MGSGQPLIILHGLFGMLDNWITLGKRYAEHFEVYLVDQRNHGKSPHSDVFNYESMAADLLEFVENHYIRGALMIGHSMGGKTLIEFAHESPFFIDKMVVADIGPKPYEMRHQHIIEALDSLDFNRIKTRREADDFLAEKIPDLPIRQFLLKNLQRTDKNTLGLKLNLEALKKNIHHVLDDMSDYKIDVPTLFLRGGNSNYILAEDEIQIREHFPNSFFATIPNAGHWLHAEKPDEFYRLTMGFLTR